MRVSALSHTKKRSLKIFPGGSLRAAADGPKSVPRIYEERSKTPSGFEISGSLLALSVYLVAAGDVNSRRQPPGAERTLSLWLGRGRFVDCT